jgi:SCP-2 sterol transfer family protein
MCETRPVAKHEFLSDEWFAIVDQLVAEHGAETPDGADIVMNLVVVDTPFGAERHLHLGARGGRAHYGIGHAPDADVTLTTDYATAKEIFVSGDPQAGMAAFFAGKVKIQGDLAKLMTMQAGGGGPGSMSALAEAVQGITS